MAGFNISDNLIVKNGNIGIGTSDPSQRLVVSGDATVNGNLYLSDQMLIGDDAWIEDFNVANSIRIKGNQSSSQGYIAFGNRTELLGQNNSGTLTFNGNTVWHAGNDGSGTGLDADLLDGQHGSYYYSPANPPTGGGGYNMIVFTSSGTYTKSSGVKDIKVTVTGGGGGNTSNSCGAGGGGAGATAIEFFDASSVSSTVSVTVGAGGLSRTSSNGYGETGGTSSFGSYCSATGGGSSHTNSYKFGAGGTATGGTINIRGADGDAGTNGSPRKGGAGGGSYWGGGGAGGSDNSVGKNGIAYGAGGGATGQCSSSGTPGNGMQGIVVVEEFF